MIAMMTAMLTMSPCNVKWEPSLTVEQAWLSQHKIVMAPMLV